MPIPAGGTACSARSAARRRHRLTPLAHRSRLRVAVLLGAVFALAVVAAPASAQLPRQGIYARAATYPGIEHLHYKFGPIHIQPGQNTIELQPNSQKPTVPGFITKFVPNLEYTDGTVPRVDVIHLHHGVWLINGRPSFAAGEEKTRVYAQRGYGYTYKPSDSWLMNYMIHNLYPNPTDVYITYDIDFVPATAPAAATMKPLQTLWVDVEGGKAYPVFDALRSLGHNGQFTFPTDAPNPYPNGQVRNQVVVPQDGTLTGTAGHLHPGGLHTDLFLTRNGRTVELFRSMAHYYEPAGAVSWDVSMTATPPGWKVQVQKGDVLSVTGTYDTSKASWYEAMAISPVAFSPGDTTGTDPFTTNMNVPGILTHGHLPENNFHGGGPIPHAPNPLTELNGSLATQQIGIADFMYQLGDFAKVDQSRLPPVVHVGQSLTFVNNDASQNIFHTITACQAPCNGSAGIAYPLANGQYDFDSGELGYGPRGFTPAANRDTWSTPTNLPPGTYTYFCRIHPFMRGSFRVVQ